MTETSQSQLRRDAVEIALWQTPSPEPAASEFAQFESVSTDLAVGNKAVGDGSSLPDLGALKDFKTWDSVAATIMRKAVSISGFNPGSPNFDPIAWNNYIHKFSTIPFFLQYQFDNRTASISSLSLEKAVNAVEDLALSIMSENDFKAVVTAIKKIGQLALENKGQQEKNSNQQVGILSRNGSNLYLGVVRTEVAMTYNQSKGYEQLQQTLSIYRGFGVLDFDKCLRAQSTLRTWDRGDVDDWENGTASASLQPNQSPAWNQ
ncbi:hypothetical protein [Nocardia beijingensis]|uniref:hypothetical protein n=1 Tax=Nocardia beijingensis TaxID=95162 RepID=UPI00083279BD|nr:hypothetical protein [Nocardia beijingensis]